MKLSPALAAEIEAAFVAAQARTGAPFGCVLARASDDYALTPVLVAAALALAAPWPLLAFTSLEPGRVFLVQLVLCGVLLAALAFAPVRAALASASAKRSACHRAAVVQFWLRGFSHAPERNGALLYVSLSERYARIVADTGLSVTSEAWRGVISELGDTLQQGDAGLALRTAATRMGDLLAQEFPAIPGDGGPKLPHFHVV